MILRPKGVTRRHFLRGAVAAAVVTALGTTPLSARIPHGFATGVIGTTFNYYISTTGSDSNVGSLASPWSITAINTKQSTYSGLSLGILPGTYDVSVLMQNAGAQGAILQIQGGPNSSTRTYIGTSNSGGTYQQGTATLDSYGSVGKYGGGNTTSYPYVIGQTAAGTGTGPVPSHLGNWTLDGLIVSGFSAWAIALGDGEGDTATIPNATVQNCTLTNSLCALSGTHPAPLMIYSATNCVVSNCWFYNNTAPTLDNVHYAAIQIFGLTGTTTGVLIEGCTFVNSSCINGGDDNGIINGVEIRQCYFDMTGAPTNFAQANAVMSFAFGTGFTAGLAGPLIHHNVIKGGYPYDCYPGNQTQYTVGFYNNTWDLAGGSPAIGTRIEESVGFGSGQTGGALFKYYNNLIYDNGSSSNGYGYVVCNSDGFAVCDYNIYGTINKFSTYPANGGTSGPTSQTFASWKTAIGGDAHSSTNATNPFTNVGIYALQYTTPSGPAFGAGRVGGLSSGAACNVGAWDGTVSQIGCSFAT